MSADRVVQCRECGADIKFITNGSSGKKHPINVKPLKVFIDVSTPEDTLAGRKVFRLLTGFESHFATCPKAEKFRKNRG